MVTSWPFRTSARGWRSRRVRESVITASTCALRSPLRLITFNPPDPLEMTGSPMPLALGVVAAVVVDVLVLVLVLLLVELEPVEPNVLTNPLAIAPGRSLL